MNMVLDGSQNASSEAFTRNDSKPVCGRNASACSRRLEGGAGIARGLAISMGCSMAVTDPSWPNSSTWRGLGSGSSCLQMGLRAGLDSSTPGTKYSKTPSSLRSNSKTPLWAACSKKFRTASCGIPRAYANIGVRNRLTFSSYAILNTCHSNSSYVIWLNLLELDSECSTLSEHNQVLLRIHSQVYASWMPQSIAGVHFAAKVSFFGLPEEFTFQNL